MIKLKDIRNWLIELTGIDENNVYTGRLDNKKPNSLGIYNLKSASKRQVYNHENKYTIKGISLLVHGSTSKSATEDLANSVYEKLDNLQSDFDLGEYRIINLELLNETPIDVDVDNSKVYEYVIEFNLYIERN